MNMKIKVTYQTYLDFETEAEAMDSLNKSKEALKLNQQEGWKVKFTDDSFTVKMSNPVATYQETLIR